MTFRDSPWPDGTPCWVDLMAPDRKKAMEFYGSLLGWDFREGPEETGFYTTTLVDGRSVAGLGEISPGQEGMPTAWTTYLAASDLDKTAAAITDAGGQIHVPPMDVMSLGRMAIAADATGAVFGLWQAGDHTGVQVANVPHALSWNECMTRDFDTAKAFYTKVFGYGFDDMSAPGFSYATLMVDGNVVGGLGALPEGTPAEVPANWGVYFSVLDTDASAAKVTELGGAVLRPPADSPYGRSAAVVDDQGAGFALIAPNEQSGKPADWA